MTICTNHRQNCPGSTFTRFLYQWAVCEELGGVGKKQMVLKQPRLVIIYKTKHGGVF